MSRSAKDLYRFTQAYREEQENLNRCIERRMEKFGESFEEAEKQCEESRYAEEEPKELGTDDRKLEEYRSLKANGKLLGVSFDEYEETEFKSKIVEKTFCGFCQEMHPTRILCGDGDIKTYALDTFHVKPEMQIDSLGLKREATNMERCISARMDVMGLSEEAATEECEVLLNDPFFKHNFINNPPRREPRVYSEEDKFIAEYINQHRDVHPEFAAWVYRKQKVEASQAPAVQKEVEGLQNLYGKSKTERIAESLQGSKYAGRLTVGDIYTEKAKAKARKERLLKELEDEERSRK